jgi:hypothetical protein
VAVTVACPFSITVGGASSAASVGGVLSVVWNAYGAGDGSTFPARSVAAARPATNDALSANGRFGVNATTVFPNR